jgi:RsiW-degrading membrane proteinase PrsW (M82 family)
MNFLLILLAIVPGILIAVYIYYLDKYEKEPGWPLLICFALGMLITLPALKIEEWAEHHGFDYSGNMFLTLVFAFVAVALTEEVLKFIVLIAFPFRQSYFNEPMDGIIYSVMIGMGFATLENILYALDFGWGTTIMRAFTAVPAHGIFAVMMGYYIGLAKFDQKNRYKLIAIGLGLAIAIHGTYDFFILQEAYEWLMILAVVTLIISIYYGRTLIKLHQDNSPFKGISEEEE